MESASPEQAPSIESYKNLAHSQLILTIFEFFVDGDLKAYLSLPNRFEPKIFFTMNKLNRNPFHIFGKFGHLHMLEYAISIFKNSPAKLSQLLNMEDKQGDTPLSLLCTFGRSRPLDANRPEVREDLLSKRFKMVLLMKDHGAKISRELGGNRNTLLHWAIFHADRQLAELAFEEHPLGALKTNKDGLTAFEIAFSTKYDTKEIQEEARKVVALLCKRYLEFMESKDTVRLFRNASKSEKRKSTNLRESLSEARKSLRRPMPSASIFATLFGTTQVKPPASSGEDASEADLNEQRLLIMDEKQQMIIRSEEIKLLQTLFGMSSYCGDPELSFMFIEKFNLSPFRRSFNNISPFCHAILAGDSGLVDRFLNTRYSYVNSPRNFSFEEVVNLHGKGGDTALHLACETQNQAICKRLVELGADYQSFNDMALRPFEIINFDAPIRAQKLSDGAGQMLAMDFIIHDKPKDEGSFQLLIVALSVSKEVRECLVYNQLKRVRKIEVQVLEPPIRKSGSLWRFFMICKASELTFARWAHARRISVFNRRKQFFEQFALGRMDQFERLRDYQKNQLLVREIHREFNLNDYKENGLIEDWMPTHDPPRTRLINETWRSQRINYLIRPFRNVYSVSDATPLNAIAFYYGCDHSLNVAFLSVYTGFLALLAILGLYYSIFLLIVWSLDSRVIPIACVVVSLVCAFFLRKWRSRQHELALIWNTRKFQYKKVELESYFGKHEINTDIDSISKKYWRWKHFRPLIINFAVILIGSGLIVITFFLYDALTRVVADSPNALWWNLLIGAANGTTNAILTFVYFYFCSMLTPWENHKFEKNLQNSLIVKICVFKFIITFIRVFYNILYEQNFNLFATSFITLVITHDLSFLFSKYAIPWGFEYLRRRSRKAIVHEKRINSAINFVTSKGWNATPLSALTPEEFKELSKASSDINRTAQLELDLIRAPPFGLMDNWIHKFIQFSFVCLLSPAFPVALVWIFLFNFVEINIDMYFLSERNKRDGCMEEKDIGNWNKIFLWISILSIGVHILILTFASEGMFWLLGLDRSVEEDKYIVLAVVSVAGTILAAFVIVIHFFLPDVPSWVKDQIILQKQLKQKEIGLGLSSKKDSEDKVENFSQYYTS